ncbi:hypothetical protein DFR67_12747 [Williamsia limnetica]|uniref:DAPG hydrolase PhiG domain-containing protein n=1 Tax=Williamsia limnetica TaxID=882452 RepID=A0A318R8S9_WILLI|nr:hypothetical protein [Williamsia limnetica]PYE11973.1 hypothetical protein DFR67_12747 [Williamsia limnetica]
MSPYQVTAADRQALPNALRGRSHGHLGYDDAERARPFAHYFRSYTEPIQPHVHDGLLRGRAPAELGYEVDDAPARLTASGYGSMETGWTRTTKGTVLVSCLTDMPDVTAQMWDWWFGWHLVDSARYKLWHPGAHQQACVADDRSGYAGLTDREKYIGNVSFVDEYIGAKKLRLAIRFVDPATLGFADRPGTTHICARIGVTYLPVAAGWLVHQVRPTERGSEMRSRFFMGPNEILSLPGRAVSLPGAGAFLASRVGRSMARPVVDVAVRANFGDRLAHDLLHHCASEMNHLAGFLPALYDEFQSMP